MINAVFRSVSQSVSRSVGLLCNCVIMWFYRIWWWVLISLFNVEFKVVGQECLMQFFDQSVNQLVGRSVVRIVNFYAGSDDGIWIRYSMQDLNSWDMNA